MESKVRVETSGDRVEVHVTGKLTRQMYEEFVPVIETAVREHGKLRLLFVMKDFHGWTAGALWDDVKFEVRHFRDISRLAIVGEKAWQHGMAVFCKPFTTAKVKYFETSELDAARAWLSQPVTRTASSS